MVRRIAGGWNVRLVFEPGRLIVGNAGVLLSRVIRVKPGATDPVRHRRRGDERSDAPGALRCLAPDRGGAALGPAMDRQRRRPGVRDRRHVRHGAQMDEVAAGDLVVFRTAGAYAAAMSSTYNSRPLTAEVLVDGDRWAVVRPGWTSKR
jgi:diaminopimelate decarboxylase